MNVRFAVSIAALIAILILTILLLSPKETQQPGSAVVLPAVGSPTPLLSPAPTPTAIRESPPTTAAAPADATETARVETPPELSQEEIELRVLAAIARFEESVDTRNEALTDELIQQLVDLGDPAVEYLIRFLNDHPNEDVREYAALAMARIGTPGAIGGLLTAIHNETNLRLKQNLRMILVTASNPEILPVLIEGLAQRDIVWWQEDALTILLNLEEHGAADALIAGYIEQPDLTERAQERFENAIGSLRDPASLETLKTALETPGMLDPVRFAAADGLAGIGTPEAVNALLAQAETTPRAEVREEVLEAVSRVRNKDASTILQGALLDNPEPDVRIASALALSGDPNEPSVELLRARLREESSEDVRNAIIRSLEQIEGAQEQ